MTCREDAAQTMSPPKQSVGDLHELGSASNPLKVQRLSRPLPPAMLRFRGCLPGRAGASRV